MRNTANYEKWINLSAKLVETPRLHSDVTIIKSNYKLFEEFIKDIIKFNPRVLDGRVST